MANTSQAPVQVRLRPARLTAEDDGRIHVDDEADELWADRILMPSLVTVPAGDVLRVPVTVQAAAGMLPDLYLVGLLAEPVNPVQGADGVKVNTRVTAVLTMEVPGERDRQLTTTITRQPRLQLGTSLRGSVDVRNIGDVGAMTRTQVRVNDTGGSNLAVLPVSGHSLQLVPAGTKRTLSYTWKADGWITYVRPSAEVSYSNGTLQLSEVTARSTAVLLIAPQALWAAGGVLVLLIGLVVVAVRQRRLGRRPVRHSATRNNRRAGANRRNGGRRATGRRAEDAVNRAANEARKIQTTRAREASRR